ncbi:GMC family oxidoreductase [Blastococcus saxobsidens]|uniref:2-methyl 1,2 propanediol dehydrogenase n=1 Tax=Blastococcus saxobsidens (strain DD2) TaxID=1146883 RepID=H6RJN3_BLASD|nr:GMC family oxidoreductase [Blastococcus saxobsidens]CCG02338.1 2-methyl 1,2 propanediol dehydrogenase [Blastococcus saxobsidens DD2]
MASYSEADVLVIGAGAGGAAVSKRLSDAGITVICLEQGDWVHPLQHPHFHSEWEIEKRRGWSHDPNVRQLPEDYPTTGNTPPLMYNAVGGSAIIYAGAWPRFKPVDFRRGTEHGVEGTIDWPISYEDLEPFYAINDAEVGVARRPGDPGNPARLPGWGPAIPPGKVGNRLARAFDTLGWHWWPADHSILTRPKDNRLACNACGPCLAGCPRHSIATPDVTYWPKALSNGVDLRTNARVERINVDKGRATGATYIDRRTGQRSEVRAKIVVLCANGVGTPRLLLMSAQAGHPDGLANSSGLVGTHLMFHAWAFEDFWFDEPIEGYKAQEAAVLYSQEFYNSDPDRGFVNGFSIQVGRSSGAAHSALGANSGNLAPWGAGHREFFNTHFGSHLLVYIQGEDLPIATNRVTLDSTVTDSSGLPAAHVNYELHENDRRLLAYGRERAREAAAVAGGLIDTSSSGSGGYDFPQPGWHLMGTARMGNTPEDSVTNKFNQTWDVPNLFIADGSSLPTSAAVNPTSTLQAVAVRCAEYIKDNHAEILGQKTTPRNHELPAG